MEVAPLQHKGRPNLPFSPTWWPQRGKEVCVYLRPGLEAVTLAQRGGLSHTDSMSVWQGQLTSVQLASHVLQGVRKMFPLSLPAHPHFMLQLWNVACGLWGCEGVSLTWLPQAFPLSPRRGGVLSQQLKCPLKEFARHLRSHRCCSWHQWVQIFSLCPCWGLNHSSARKQASQCAPLLCAFILLDRANQCLVFLQMFIAEGRERGFTFVLIVTIDTFESGSHRNNVKRKCIQIGPSVVGAWTLLSGQEFVMLPRCCVLCLGGLTLCDLKDWENLAV